jgi:hypothetical protein
MQPANSHSAWFTPLANCQTTRARRERAHRERVSAPTAASKRPLRLSTYRANSYHARPPVSFEEEVRLRERAIAKDDRLTPVGDWSDWTTGFVDSEGRWNSGTVPVLIPADANAIVAADTQAQIVLSGRLSELREPDDPEAELSFLCGEVMGAIIDPITVDDLGGSTFAGARLDDVGDATNYPEITINCAHDLPRPLP